jgi:gas vesicle protein
MKNSGKKLAVGTIVAGAIGYVAGILTAPKSGKETRKDIGDAASRAKNEAERKLKSLHSELSLLINQSKERLSKLSAEAKKDLMAAIDKAQSAREKARQILSGFHEGDAGDKDLQTAIKEADQAITHLKSFLTKTVSPKSK